MNKAINELEPENPYGDFIISPNGTVSLTYTGHKSPKILAAVYEGNKMKQIIALQGDMNGIYTGIIKEYKPGIRVKVIFLKENNAEPLYDRIEK